MNVDILVGIACDVFNVTLDNYKNRRHEADFYARICVMKHLHENGFNYSHIGRICNKDRVTVMHGIEQYDNLYGYDRQFHKLAKQFNKKVRMAWREIHL